MAKKKTKFVCQNCGSVSPKWMGRCVDCGMWNTFVEEVEESTKDNRGFKAVKGESSKPIQINKLQIEREERFTTGIDEFDRVLGGGLVIGSLVLIGGNPGIGKSTLLIQVSNRMAVLGKKVLYVSGEESIYQIKMRAKRLGLENENLYLLGENNLDVISRHMDEMSPDVVIIDSIQTMFSPDVASAPGSVSQVRESTGKLMKICKLNDISTFIVGHVTKDGSIAGPRVLEHMVDTVVYFEGDRYNAYRMVRAVKNRFGSTNELGLFEMKDNGLNEINNPSSILISERPDGVSGSSITCVVEGTRSMLVEIQALVSPASVGIPRRTSIGIESSRLSLLLAVLEKRVGVNIISQDVYLNVIGGLKLNEPSIDLAIVASLVSSYKNKEIDSKTMMLGEIGLTGEVRSVGFIEKRILEGKNLGFKKAIVPQSNMKNLEKIKGIEIIGVDNVKSALNAALGGKGK